MFGWVKVCRIAESKVVRKKVWQMDRFSHMNTNYKLKFGCGKARTIHKFAKLSCS